MHDSNNRSGDRIDVNPTVYHAHSIAAAYEILKVTKNNLLAGKITRNEAAVTLKTVIKTYPLTSLPRTVEAMLEMDLEERCSISAPIRDFFMPEPKRKSLNINESSTPAPLTKETDKPFEPPV